MSDGSLSRIRSAGKPLHKIPSFKMNFVASVALDSFNCLVLAIDLQTSLLNATEDGERIKRRSEYLLRSASVLGVQVIATSQNASKLGPVCPEIGLAVHNVFDKVAFSAWRDPDAQRHLQDTKKQQLVLCGVETHICVYLTAQDLLENGYQVVVCPDAVGSANAERHKLGMERIRDAGAVPSHSEAVVYEWLGSASHPKFREILSLTKDNR